MWCVIEKYNTSHASWILFALYCILLWFSNVHFTYIIQNNLTGIVVFAWILWEIKIEDNKTTAQQIYTNMCCLYGVQTSTADREWETADQPHWNK